MSRKYEERTYTTKNKVQVSRTCDLCGKTAQVHSGWTNNSFEILETTCELQEGQTYPECGSKEVTSVDICPACFKNKLLPWVHAQGGEPTTTESDW